MRGRRADGRGGRALLVAAGGVLAAGVALAALTAILAHRASRELENAIRGAAFEVAQVRARRGAEAIRDRARGILDRLERVRRSGGLADLASLRQGEPLAGTPFAVDAEGRFVWPFPAADVDPLLAFESGLEAARTVEAVGGDPIEAIAAYRAVAERTGAGKAPEAEVLRIRARAAEAATRRRAGDLDGAIAVYEGLLSLPPARLWRAAPPTPLQLRLACIRTLSEAGRPRDAAGRARAFVEEAAGGAIPSAPEELAFFLDAALEALGPSPPPEVLEAKALAERWVRYAPWVAVWLRDRRGAAGGIEGASGRIGGAWAVAFWRDAGGGAVGFVADAGAVRAALEEAVEGGAPEPPAAAEPPGVTTAFRLEVVDAGAADRRPLAPFPHPLRFLGLELPAGERARLVGSARAGNRVLAGLAALLALISALAVVAVVRGVREARRLSRMRTEFVAGVSHDLKTPLALVRLYAESLALGRIVDPGKREAYLRTILREAHRLTHLVENILAFARIDAGRTAYRREAADPAAIVRETVEAYRAELEHRGFAIDVAIDPDLPGIEADRDALGQAILNLLDNAAKYSPEGKRIAVRARQDGGGVRIEVEDEGIGIRPEDVERIFEEFHRADEARALGTRGSGLGLALVRHVAEAHGGRVDVRSRPGAGSTFALVIPARSGGGGRCEGS